MSRSRLEASRSLFLRFGAPVSAMAGAFLSQVLRALDESRRREGARLIRQYQYLLDEHKQ